jgi:hypothetical protein
VVHPDGSIVRRHGPRRVLAAALAGLATLVGTTLTSTLTLEASAAALDGTAIVTVTGTMAALTDDATLTLDVRSLVVNGRVLTTIGTPLPAIGVSSQGRTAMSAADGSFRLDGLSLPYDLTLASSSGTGGMHV